MGVRKRLELPLCRRLVQRVPILFERERVSGRYLPDLTEPPDYFVTAAVQEKQMNFLRLDRYIRDLQERRFHRQAPGAVLFEICAAPVCAHHGDDRRALRVFGGQPRRDGRHRRQPCHRRRIEASESRNSKTENRNWKIETGKSKTDASESELWEFRIPIFVCHSERSEESP